jgi:hypothetical protein
MPYSYLKYWSDINPGHLLKLKIEPEMSFILVPECVRVWLSNDVYKENLFYGNQTQDRLTDMGTK